MYNQKEYLKKYYQNNRKKIKIKSHDYYIKYKKYIIAKNKKWNQSLHGKAVRLTKKFNISYKEALKWLKIKKCQICGDNLAVATDHNHKTGKIRGRLCFRCNRAMGAFKDSIKILKKVIKYLKEQK